MTSPAKDRKEEGTTIIEAMMIAGAALLLIGLLIAGIRISWAHNAVQEAAAAAARDGSLARNAGQAQANANTAATVSMAQSGADCVGQNVVLDTSRFLAPLGETGTIRVTVNCTVPLANLVPGLPGAMNVSRSANSPVDPYRQR
jgi:Flp pilus assembly protein TadG